MTSPTLDVFHLAQRSSRGRAGAIAGAAEREGWTGLARSRALRRLGWCAAEPADHWHLSYQTDERGHNDDCARNPVPAGEHDNAKHQRRRKSHREECRSPYLTVPLLLCVHGDYLLLWAVLIFTSGRCHRIRSKSALGLGELCEVLACDTGLRRGSGNAVFIREMSGGWSIGTSLRRLSNQRFDRLPRAI